MKTGQVTIEKEEENEREREKKKDIQIQFLPHRECCVPQLEGKWLNSL